MACTSGCYYSFYLVLLMMDAERVRNMYSNLAVTNKQYCQSCILLVLYIIFIVDICNETKQKATNVFTYCYLQYIIRLTVIYKGTLKLL